MLFNSYLYILLFLPITAIIYNCIKKYLVGYWQFSLVFLTIMNLIFYGCFNKEFVVLLFIIITFNFFITNMYRVFTKKKKLLLFIAIIFNLGLLTYFKYTNFFIQIIDKFGQHINLLNILVPIGVSFFTFQQLSFLIDCYRDENIKYSFLEYLSYASFFPIIIQGPISYHSEIIPQLKNKKLVSSIEIYKGMFAFTIGLAKKVLLADVLGAIAAVGFDNISGLNSTTAIICMLAYTFQIYFDFSGYSDMAIGSGYLFGVEIPENFNLPYKAMNITDFWHRWHITLTRFFTKYIYIPLGGNRNGTIKTYCNVLIIFFISGLWHGANYTFIVWGIMHGIASVFDRILSKTNFNRHDIFSWICTFLFVNVAWVFFRANSIQEAIGFLYHIVNFNFGSIAPALVEQCKFPLLTIALDLFHLNRIVIYMPYFYLQILFIISLSIILKEKSLIEIFKDWNFNYIKTISIAILLWLSIISLVGQSSFIYTNF